MPEQISTRTLKEVRVGDVKVGAMIWELVPVEIIQRWSGWESKFAPVPMKVGRLTGIEPTREDQLTFWIDGNQRVCEFDPDDTVLILEGN